MSGPIQTYVPKSEPVKAFQLPDGSWIVLSTDLASWEQLSEADFNAKYQSA